MRGTGLGPPKVNGCDASRACSRLTAARSVKAPWPVAVMALLLVAGVGGARAQTGGGAEAGFANLPRFVSLKASRVNLRKGPGLEYPTAWVFRREGLPVEVVREYRAWREVRDAEGTKGWVIRSLLSRRRTGQIAPWEVKPDGSRPIESLTASKSDRGRTIARVEAGVIADLHACDGTWCRVTVAGYKGYIRQTKIWGIYPDERF